MTQPPSPAPVAPRPQRPTSLVSVVLGVVLAMLFQAGSLLAVHAAIQPAPTGGSTPRASDPRSSEARTPTASRSAMPAQTVAPVTVTDELKRGVVLVSGRSGDQNVAGTGMVLTADGQVLTNYHVVRSTRSLTVTVAATGRRYEAELVGRDATRDVALLQLRGARGLQPVRIDDDPIAVGDIVVAAGNANGQGFVTAHRGNVLQLDQSIQVRSASENDPAQTLSGLIKTNAPAWPGDSGGPMFDAETEVTGMTTAGSTPSGVDVSSDTTDRQVYAVPIRSALQVVDQIRRGDEGGTVVIGPKAYLGVIVVAEDDARAKVLRVEPGSPAAEVGLDEGDVITGIDGGPVASRPELSSRLDAIEPGQSVPITWQDASGRERTASITPTRSPNN